MELIITDSVHRQKNINEFQRIFWDSNPRIWGKAFKELSYLAYNLDYYMPGYPVNGIGPHYGDHKLVEEVRKALSSVDWNDLIDQNG